MDWLLQDLYYCDHLKDDGLKTQISRAKVSSQWSWWDQIKGKTELLYISYILASEI